jgi:ribosomal protein S18 acetylase RimI-like enzyme
VIATTATPRRATTADIPALARTLTRTFHDDPAAEWSCPPEQLRPRVLERFYAARLRQILAEDEVWVDPSLAGAALWLPPKRWRVSTRDSLELMRCMASPRLLPRLPLVVRGLRGMEQRHPHDPPHWYLAILGTDPESQGQGIGSAVLRPVLERCDEDGVAAYLESSKESNIAFYARHGFKVTEEVDLPRGPRIWLMWRDPL